MLNWIRRTARQFRLALTIGMFAVVLAPQAGVAAIALGAITFTRADALPLDNPVLLSQGLQSHSYLSSVGGVAFGALAKGENGLQIVGLEYEPRAKDGARLTALLENKGGKVFKAVAAIYDWQLAPIARLAASDQQACFTLFGRVADAQEQQLRRAKGQYILGYHPALKDTLLGLRLMQADILILYPDSCDLPKVDGKYVLGAGELAPNVDANRQALGRLHQRIDALGQKFQSYVVCDHEQEVTYRMQQGALVLSGNPVWYCWRSKISDQATLNELQDRANAKANQILNEEFQRDSGRLSVIEFNQKWTPAYQKQRHSEVFDQGISANVVQPLPELSREISIAVQQLQGVNPAVYNALVTTLRYTALLRQVRAMDEAKYREFVQVLDDVKFGPEVETPSAMLQPRNPVQNP